MGCHCDVLPLDDELVAEARAFLGTGVPLNRALRIQVAASLARSPPGACRLPCPRGLHPELVIAAVLVARRDREWWREIERRGTGARNARRRPSASGCDQSRPAPPRRRRLVGGTPACCRLEGIQSWRCRGFHGARAGRRAQCVVRVEGAGRGLLGFLGRRLASTRTRRSSPEGRASSKVVTQAHDLPAQGAPSGSERHVFVAQVVGVGVCDGGEGPTTTVGHGSRR